MGRNVGRYVWRRSKVDLKVGLYLTTRPCLLVLDVRSYYSCNVCCHFDNFCKWSRFSSRGQFLPKGVVAGDLSALLQARRRRRELFVTIFLQILWMILMGQHRANNLVLNQTYQRNLIIIFCLKQLNYLKIFQCIQIMRWFLWVFWPPFGIKIKITNLCQIAHNQYWFLLIS